MAMYSLFTNGEVKNLTVFVDGELLSVTNQHPNFDEILSRVETDNTENLKNLIDNSVVIAEKFHHVSDQVSIRGGSVFFDGDLVDELISDHILRFYNENKEDSFMPLVRFLEKLKSNPNQHSVYHLFRWLKQQDLAITPSGDLIAYKGVNQDLTSRHKGDGIVDGVQMTNVNLPNNVGSLIEMPRSLVTFDPEDGCSFGLHAGTWDYANGFGVRTLEVHINPRDVVSVPVDCNAQKMRTCRYRVVQELNRPYDVAYVNTTYSWDEDSHDWDDSYADDYDDFLYEKGDRVIVFGRLATVQEDAFDSDDRVSVSFDTNPELVFTVEVEYLNPVVQ